MKDCNRLDRHIWYVWPNAGLFLLGISLTIFPITTGVLATVDYGTQQLLAVCLIIGSAIVLIGSMTPSRVDKRSAYRLGVAGMFVNAIAMSNYFYYVYSNSSLLGTLGGALTFALGGACIHMGIYFIVTIRRINKKIPKVAPAVIALEKRDNA